MYLIKTVALIYLLATSVSALAAASGSSPKGKPFVEINGQIVEVQGQIATLEQRMDNLLARVVLNEFRLDGIDAGIALLQQQNQDLSLKLADLESGLTTIDEITAELEATNLALQSEIDDFGDLTGELALEIAGNTLAIDTMKGSMDNGFEALLLLIGQNSGMIAELQMITETLAQQAELKQNVLNGSCEEGSMLIGFEDGALVCEQIVQQGGPIELIQVTKTKLLGHQAVVNPQDGNIYNISSIGGDGRWYGGGGRLEVRCPHGTSLMGGGPLNIPDYFLEAVDRGALSNYAYSTFDNWIVDVYARNTRGSGRWNWNPLWLPHVLGGADLKYTYTKNPPDEPLVASVFALCARAASNEPIE